ncbi:MAG: cation transporter [Actinobacteria bacterium]|nr:cation transporter [Actinomycetota bacterium]
MNLKTVELSADMNCRACQYRITGALKQQDGVKSNKADFRTQKVTIEFDPSQIDETELRQVIDNALNHGLSLE